MEAIIGIMSENPIASVLVIFFIIAFLIFITFKVMSKAVLLVFVIFLIAFGYYYYQDPDKVRDYCKSMLSVITELPDKRKTFLQDSKEVYTKTKDAPGQVNKMLDSSKKELNK